MISQPFSWLLPDLLLCAAGIAAWVFVRCRRRRKQCVVCRKYYGDDILLAEQYQRCPECGTALGYPQKTLPQRQDSGNKSAADSGHLPIPNISPASYLQYRTAARESCMIVSFFLLFCCFCPLLIQRMAQGLFHGTFVPWTYRYGITLMLMFSAWSCRPLLEQRLALYYGLITRCIYCQQSFYSRRGIFPSASGISRILFSGKCPHCHGKIVR